MAKKKQTKTQVKQMTKEYVKAKGYRLPHGYEVVVRKTKPKK